MLEAIGVPSLAALIDQTIPPGIRSGAALDLPEAETEHAYLRRLRSIASRNTVARSYIGLGYYGCITPSVILRNVFENPGWYTPYTPYQAEIAQGRLESLLNFQTVVRDLTAMDIATASLLDEGTAAAEAMAMFHRLQSRKAGSGESVFLVGQGCYPQTLDVLRGRAEPLEIRVEIVDPSSLSSETLSRAFGLLLQYPDDRGGVVDLRPVIERAHASGALVAVATDLLALTLMTPPGEMGADAVVGNSQRFGVPLGCGGPHAAFLATREAYVRQAPGRIIGLSIDARGRQAYRMALQTREQHIRREKATSNICTAQALLANIAAMYAVYHGPAGLRAIASGIRDTAAAVERVLTSLGYRQTNDVYFDTLWIEGGDRAMIRKLAQARAINFRYTESAVGIAFDETVANADAQDVVDVFAEAAGKASPAVVHRRRHCRNGPADAPAVVRVSDASGVQQPPLRDADDAVYPLARAEGRGARYLDDSPRLLHDEAQRRVGDDSGLVAGVCGHPSVRARVAARRLHPDLPRARGRPLHDHGVRRRVPAAEFRRTGRTGGSDDDSRLPPRSRRTRTHGRPHSLVGARNESGERGNGRPQGRRRGVRRRWQRRFRTTCAPVRRSTATSSRR